MTTTSDSVSQLEERHRTTAEEAGSWGALTRQFRSEGVRRIAANSAWLAGDKIFRALLGLLVGAWVARYLGPERFGMLAYVLSLVALFLPFATLSADAIVVRMIAQAPHDAPRVLGSAAVARVLMGFAAWAAAVGSVALAGGGAELTVLTAITAGLLLFQGAEVVDLWFQSQTQSRRTVLARLMAYLAATAFKVGLVLADAPLEAFAAVVAVEAALAAIALGVAYRQFPTDQRWSATTSIVKALLREAWPFIVSGFAIAIYARVDQLLIKQFIGTHQLGLYAAIMPLSQFWQMVPMTLAVSIAPFVARQKMADPQRYERSLVLIFRGFFWFGIVAAVVTVVLSDWLVRVLFGADYAAAAPVLAVHSLSNVFCFLGIAHGIWLVNERMFAVRLWGTMLAGLVSILFNVALLPRIGLVGAAITAIVTQAIAAVLINAVFDRRGLRLQVEAVTFLKA